MEDEDNEGFVLILTSVPKEEDEEDEGRPLQWLVLDGKGDELNKFFAASMEDLLLTNYYIKQLYSANIAEVGAFSSVRCLGSTSKTEHPGDNIDKAGARDKEVCFRPQNLFLITETDEVILFGCNCRVFH